MHSQQKAKIPQCYTRMRYQPARLRNQGGGGAAPGPAYARVAAVPVGIPPTGETGAFMRPLSEKKEKSVMFRVHHALISGCLLACAAFAYGQCPVDIGAVDEWIDTASTPIWSCDTAHELPGTAGVHTAGADVSGDRTYVVGNESRCGQWQPFTCGNETWFKIRPDATGQIEFHTCNLNTEFDTFVQAYRCTDTADPCNNLVEIECNDDYQGTGCNNPCGAAWGAYLGSRVKFNARAGTWYYFRVGSYDDNYFNCNTCLGVSVELEDPCSGDAEAPEAQIRPPYDSQLVCGMSPIVGDAWDPDPEAGGLPKDEVMFYSVEYRAVGDSTWYQLPYPDNGDENTPVIADEFDVSNPPEDPSDPNQGGVLAWWDTLATDGGGEYITPPGLYLLRVTVKDICRTQTQVRVVRVHQGEAEVELTYPYTGDVNSDGIADNVVWGKVCVYGRVRGFDMRDPYFPLTYTVEYREVGEGDEDWRPIDPANPVRDGWRINRPLGYWDTRRPEIGDGQYEMRLVGFITCGFNITESITEVRTPIIVDSQRPEAVITSPVNCEAVGGDDSGNIIQIVGTANDNTLHYWRLRYLGGPNGRWGWIPTIENENGIHGNTGYGYTPVVDDVLANWDVSGLDPCVYTIQLYVREYVRIHCNRAGARGKVFYTTISTMPCTEITP